MRAPLLFALVLLAAPLGRAAAQDGYPSREGYPVPAVQGVPMAPRKVTLMRVLDHDLERLAQQSDGRVLDGTLELVLGGAFVGLGIWIDDPLFRSIMVLSGSVSMGRGVNTLALEPDAEDALREFRGMSMATPADVEARLRYGDAALAALAQRWRAARIVQGSLTMTGCAAYTPLYWYFRQADDPGYRFGDDGMDYVGLAISTIGFASGLITTLRKSQAERRNLEYRALKQRLYPSVTVAPQLSPHAARVVIALRY